MFSNHDVYAAYSRITIALARGLIYWCLAFGGISSNRFPWYTAIYVGISRSIASYICIACQKSSPRLDVRKYYFMYDWRTPRYHVRNAVMHILHTLLGFECVKSWYIVALYGLRLQLSRPIELLRAWYATNCPTSICSLHWFNETCSGRAAYIMILTAFTSDTVEAPHDILFFPWKLKFKAVSWDWLARAYHLH